MKKILQVFVLLFITNLTLIAQNFDVRNVNWGMNKDEIINSEYPQKAIIDGNEISFKNVNIGNGLTTKLIYYFSANKLVELRYIVFGSKYSKGTCDNIIPFSNKVTYSNFILNNLKSQGYKCNIGWYVINGTHLVDVTKQRKDYWNCDLDVKTISMIDNIAKKEGGEWIGINLENSRSNASFRFNEHQNSKYKELSPTPCNSDRYNILFWLIIKPN